MKDFENRPGSGFSLIFQDSKNYRETLSQRWGGGVGVGQSDSNKKNKVVRGIRGGLTSSISYCKLSVYRTIFESLLCVKYPPH